MTLDPEYDQLQEEVSFRGSSFAEAPPTSGYNTHMAVPSTSISLKYLEASACPGMVYIGYQHDSS